MDTLNSYKLTLIFIFSIVIPATLLSIFAVAAISSERRAYEERVRQRLHDGADKVAAEADRKLAARADELLRQVASFEGTVEHVDGLLDVVRGLGKAEGAGAGTGEGVAGPAFLVGPGGALLHPDLGPIAGAPLPRSAPDPAAQARLDVLFRPAEELEQRSESAREAIEAYDTIARTHRTDGVVQVEVLWAKGRIYRRLGDDLNALECYRQLAEEHPLGRDVEGRILAPGAWLELAEIQGRYFRNTQRQVAALLACVETVARHEEALGQGATSFYLGRALELLGALEPQAARRAQTTLDAARREREGARAFARVLKGLFLPRLAQALEAATAAAAATSPSGSGAGPGASRSGRDLRAAPPATGQLVERTPDGRVVVLYSVVRRGRERGATPLGLVGFRLDLDAYRRRELEPILVAAAHEEGSFKVVERAPAGAPGSAEAGEMARVPLRAPLDHLEVVAVRRDDDPGETISWARETIYYWAIALTLLGLGAGAFVVTRTVGKEMKASELKSDFVTNVTHELKTPLTSIGMFAETLLLGRVKDKKEAQECLEIISKEADRLRTLIDRVLTFSKIEAGKKRYDLKLTDMGAMVEETCDLFRRQMRTAPKPVNVEVTIVQGLTKVLADRESIEEVLLNLLSNAYKYGGHDKRIQVTVTRRRKWLAVDVQDWGVGIPWREQRKIFRKFYRANDVLTREVEGSGIGLTLARSIARAHRGDITVKSKVGKGSAFTLWLPR